MLEWITAILRDAPWPERSGLCRQTGGGWSPQWISAAMSVGFCCPESERSRWAGFESLQLREGVKWIPNSDLLSLNTFYSQDPLLFAEVMMNSGTDRPPDWCGVSPRHGDVWLVFPLHRSSTLSYRHAAPIGTWPIFSRSLPSTQVPPDTSGSWESSSELAGLDERGRLWKGNPEDA